MCLIIDTCCLANVFDVGNKDHDGFLPVLNWIMDGGGKVIYGGTRYKAELKGAAKYIPILAELSRRGKVVLVNDGDVDAIEKEILLKEKGKDFDDPHLIALVIASRCKVICTNDKRAYPFIKKTELYPGRMGRPRIYSGKRNSNLLSNANITGVCI